MQGKWKERLSGYNHKGTKRKKQNRKQSINDKYDYFEKACLKDNSKYLYIYNKPTERRDWSRGSSKKFYQNKFSRRTRRIINKYINKKEWDNSFSVPDMKKSVLWEMY